MLKLSECEIYMQKMLFESQDLGYKEFQSKLIPNIDKDTVIGVRTPQLRKFAKEFAKNPLAQDFLQIIPHHYYEENNIHGLLIENIRDFDRVVFELDRFLPYIDNWATCDIISPKIFKKHLPELIVKINEWIKSGDTYTIRFALKMLMSFYLDSEFKPEYLSLASVIKSDEYYVNMMIAWFFATALAKQYDETIKYIENKKLPQWVHNKAIQKAVESYRITDEQKDYLRTLKIKP